MSASPFDALLEAELLVNIPFGKSVKVGPAYKPQVAAQCRARDPWQALEEVADVAFKGIGDVDEVFRGNALRPGLPICEPSFLDPKPVRKVTLAQG